MENKQHLRHLRSTEGPLQSVATPFLLDNFLLIILFIFHSLSITNPAGVCRMFHVNQLR